MSRRASHTDAPPLEWSALRYGFRAKEDRDAEEETQARGDRFEAAPGRRAGIARAERCRRGTLDWGYGVTYYRWRHSAESNERSHFGRNGATRKGRILFLRTLAGEA